MESRANLSVFVYNKMLFIKSVLYTGPEINPWTHYRAACMFCKIKFSACLLRTSHAIETLKPTPCKRMRIQRQKTAVNLKTRRK